MGGLWLEGLPQLAASKWMREGHQMFDSIARATCDYAQEAK